jgi:DnaK suppressor protein
MTNDIFSPDKEYMNEEQLKYFKDILLKSSEELNKESQELKLRIESINSKTSSQANDDSDLINDNDLFSSLIRQFDRNRKHLTSIEISLDKIEKKTFGFCEKTGAQIGIKRLIAKPTARLCAQAQEAEDNKIHSIKQAKRNSEIDFSEENE